MSIVIGLTGQTGAGKTTVCRVFEQKGFGIIDAVTIARRVVEKGKPCLMELAAAFGKEILSGSGELDRKKLGSIVFSHKEKLTLLNSIIYPYITEDIRGDIEKLSQQGKEFILLDAPTLFESGADKLCSAVAAVTADEDIRLERIIRRDGITEKQARARMSSQHTEEFFRNNSSYVIDNSKGERELFEAAEKTADSIIKRFHSAR